MTIKTAAELNEAVRGGARELELDATEPVALSGAEGVTLTGRVDLRAGLADWTDAVALNGCRGVVLDGLAVVGEPRAAGGFVGRGVTVRGGSDNSIRRCDVSQLIQGVLLLGGERTSIVGSDFHDIQADGVQFQGVVDLLVAENWFRRFLPTPGVHADCVQGMSNAVATDDCDGVTVRDNLLDVFVEDQVQGVFLSDARFGGHRRVLIEDNLVFNTAWHGVSPIGCKDPVVRRNRLFRLAGSSMVPRIITLGIPATLEDNEAPEYTFKKYGDPLPPTNRINKPIAMDEFDRLRAGWLAAHRAPPAPQLTDLQRAVLDAEAAIARVKALAGM